jgi:hypothetical protein
MTMRIGSRARRRFLVTFFSLLAAWTAVSGREYRPLPLKVPSHEGRESLSLCALTLLLL